MHLKLFSEIHNISVYKSDKHKSENRNLEAMQFPAWIKCIYIAFWGGVGTVFLDSWQGDSIPPSTFNLTNQTSNGRGDERLLLWTRLIVVSRAALWLPPASLHCPKHSHRQVAAALSCLASVWKHEEPSIDSNKGTIIRHWRDTCGWTVQEQPGI